MKPGEVGESSIALKEFVESFSIEVLGIPKLHERRLLCYLSLVKRRELKEWGLACIMHALCTADFER